MFYSIFQFPFVTSFSAFVYFCQQNNMILLHQYILFYWGEHQNMPHKEKGFRFFVEWLEERWQVLFE